MIKLTNITTQKKKLTTRAEISFVFQGRDESVWFETNSNLKVASDASSFLSFIILPAMFVAEDIDLSDSPISEKLMVSSKKIQSIYSNWFPELELKKIKIINAQPETKLSEDGIVASFFSGGIDSFDTVLNSDKDITDAKIKKLIYVYGYDVRVGDDLLFKKTSEYLDAAANYLNKDIVYITTNLREFTERLFSWDFIHGAALVAIGHIFSQSISTLYIPASNSVGQFTPNGSHPELDLLFASETLDIIHYGIERKRIDKIFKNIAYSPTTLKYLRVCWKNSGGKLNCGKCEKCVRTMVELEVAGLLSKASTFSNPLTSSLLESISIPNEGTANLYRELLPYLKGGNFLKKLYSKIDTMLKNFDSLVNQEKMKNQEYTRSNGFVRKNKNILFLDFNGVLSYDPFWTSLRDTKHSLHPYYETIETYLFKDNISIVIDWMVGKYTSEEIHEILKKEINIPYEELFAVFCEDCSNIDISEKILKKIQTLREFYSCILVTDNMDSFDRFTIPHNPQLVASFDRIDNSYTMGRFKKSDNGRYFVEQVEERQVVMENCILIDDSKDNCTLFESIGGRAYATKTENDVLKVLDDIHNSVKHKWEWQY